MSGHRARAARKYVSRIKGGRDIDVEESMQ
jgi:hypothetical protein